MSVKNTILQLTPKDKNHAPIPLIELITEAGLSIRCDCGGLGVCGKCLVRVQPAQAVEPPGPDEVKKLGQKRLEQGVRLACQVKVLAQVTVEIFSQTLSSREANGKQELKGSFLVDALVKRKYLNLSPDKGDVLSAIYSSSNNQEQSLAVPRSLGAVRQLSTAVKSKEEFTLVMHQDQGLTAAYPGREEQGLGLALDIGTTTLAAYLCDFSNGQLLAAVNSANPQRGLGNDVISRITYAGKHKNGLDLLCRLVREEVNNLIAACLKKVGGNSKDIDEVVVVGNTTMQQIFCGLDLQYLGEAPYRPLCSDLQNYSALELGLNLSPGVNVCVFPVVSGFVGGDTLAAALAAGLNTTNETTLLVDIGTNGEVVLSHKGQLYATSCATGPTFEGAHLSCGMRAVKGAVSRIVLDSENLTATYQTIGQDQGAKPSGLCGSGVIDAVAQMRLAKILRKNGRLQEGMPKVMVNEKGVGQNFCLIPGSLTATSQDIAFTLKDVRQVQLAKAALFAGIKLLMVEAKVSSLKKQILTGAFGANFDWRSAVTIGMLPKEAEKMESMVNGAGYGACAALLDHKKRDEVCDLAKRIKVLDLARHPDFSMEFGEAIQFPALCGLD